MSQTLQMLVSPGGFSTEFSAVFNSTSQVHHWERCRQPLTKTCRKQSLPRNQLTTVIILLPSLFYVQCPSKVIITFLFFLFYILVQPQTMYFIGILCEWKTSKLPHTYLIVLRVKSEVNRTFRVFFHYVPNESSTILTCAVIVMSQGLSFCETVCLWDIWPKKKNTY